MHINIAALLSSGRPDGTMLEKIADKVLTLPRAMWQGRIVTPISKTDMSLPGSGTSEKIRKTVVYGILTLVATPLLLLGLALKAVALAADPAARIYNPSVQPQLKVQKQPDKQEESELLKQLNLAPPLNSLMEKYAQLGGQITTKHNLISAKEILFSRHVLTTVETILARPNTQSQLNQPSNMTLFENLVFSDITLFKNLVFSNGFAVDPEVAFEVFQLAEQTFAIAEEQAQVNRDMGVYRR